MSSTLSTGRPDHSLEDILEQARTIGIVVDRDYRIAFVDGVQLDLPFLEFELFAYLVENPYRVHSREHLLAAVWGHDYDGGTRTVDVHVARLRGKLGPARRHAVETLRRAGYRFRP